jgi:hypothetical protein
VRNSNLTYTEECWGNVAKENVLSEEENINRGIEK